MKQTQLFHIDGKSSHVWYCGECKIVYRTEQDAAQCCQPYACNMCGTSTGRYLMRCRECSEKARFDKAEKLQEWGGCVYRDGFGYREGYFSDMAEFLDWYEDNKAELDEPIAYVWACSEDRFVNASLDDVISRITDQAYEDFEISSLHGLPELKAALDKFNDENACHVAYNPDYKRAVLIPTPTKGE